MSWNTSPNRVAGGLVLEYDSAEMVLETRIYVEHPNLALSHTIKSLNDLSAGVISDAGTDPDHDVYFFWVETEDFELLNATLAEDHTIAAFTPVVDTGSRRTYRIEYSEDAKLITPGVVAAGGITLEATNYLTGWRLHLEFPDHESLLALNEYANDEGIQLEILELHQRDSPIQRDELDLTESQREALVGAFIHGYYDDPRTVTQEELASILEISSSALSGRLRRGSARLIEAYLVDDESPALDEDD